MTSTATVMLTLPGLQGPVSVEVDQPDLGPLLALALTQLGGTLVDLSINSQPVLPEQQPQPQLPIDVQPEAGPAAFGPGKGSHRVSSSIVFPHTRKRWARQDIELLRRFMAAYPDQTDFRRHEAEICEATGRTMQALIAKRWALLNPEAAAAAGKKSA